MEKMKLTKSEWLSFFAIVIAAVALIISAWQAYLIRHHNQISVQPLIDIEAKKETIFNNTTDVVWLEIANNGLGPAIIESETLMDGKKLLDRKNLGELVFNLGHAAGFDLVKLKKNTFIQPGESAGFVRFPEDRLFYSCSKSKIEKDGRELHYKKFMSIEVRVKYRTLYGKKEFLTYKLGELFPNCAEQIQWKMNN